MSKLSLGSLGPDVPELRRLGWFPPSPAAQYALLLLGIVLLAETLEERLAATMKAFWLDGGNGGLEAVAELGRVAAGSFAFMALALFVCGWLQTGFRIGAPISAGAVPVPELKPSARALFALGNSLELFVRAILTVIAYVWIFTKLAPGTLRMEQLPVGLVALGALLFAVVAWRASQTIRTLLARMAR